MTDQLALFTPPTRGGQCLDAVPLPVRLAAAVELIRDDPGMPEEERWMLLLAVIAPEREVAQ